MRAEGSDQGGPGEGIAAGRGRGSRGAIGDRGWKNILRAEHLVGYTILLIPHFSAGEWSGRRGTLRLNRRFRLQECSLAQAWWTTLK